MRPNADIPWTLHGQIKDYAQANNLTIERAYIETIERGLESLPLPVEAEDAVADYVRSYLPFGPQPLSVSEGDINEYLTFLPRMGHPRQPVVFRALGTRRAENEELKTILTRLAKELTHEINDWFTIHQLGGAWVGRGLHNYAHALSTTDQRWADADFRTYKTEFGLYVAELRENELLFIRTEAGTHREGVSELRVGFLTDGYPIQSSRYTRLAAQFGFDELGAGIQKTFPSLRAGFSDAIELEMVEPLLKDDRMSRRDEPWVSGGLVKNPFKNDDVLQRLIDDTPETEVEEIFDQHLLDIDHLQSYDKVYCEFSDHHPADEDHEYKMDAVSVTPLHRVFGRQSPVNMSISATYI
ncbi:hypothetical protein [Salinigranum halophilum]|uniref:hypothetical protein n=1 Tax=Salinigranum halophilum TaxID=2565931 RepID=UPI0010A7658F|nr:hypothetical protein [Salinigranum halophilum]